MGQRIKPDESQFRHTVNWAPELTQQWQGLPRLADNRLLMICVEPEFSWPAYFRYLEWCYKEAKLHDRTCPKYMFYYGYIPVCMPPSFWTAQVYGEIISGLVRNHIPFAPRPSIAFDGHKYEELCPDLWVSRMWLAEHHGGDPKEYTVKKVLELCQVC